MIRTCLFYLCGSMILAAPLSAAEVDYATQIHPLLNKYCLGCHTGVEPDGGVRLDQADSFTTPLESGLKPLIPGNRADSHLYQLLLGTAEPKMPPEDEPAPTAAEIDLIGQWIDAGAQRPKTLPAVMANLPDIPVTGTVRNPAYAAAWHPSGTQYAIGRQGRVELYAADQDQLLWQVANLTGAINDLVFSPDGSRLFAVAGRPGLAGELTCISVSEGQPQWTQTSHDDAITSVAINAAGTQIATGSYDRTIQLWDPVTGEPQGVLRGHHGAINQVAFHPSKNWLASAADDETLKLWDTAERRRLATLSDPTEAQTAVQFSPDGSRLVGAGLDKRIRIWAIDASLPTSEPPLLYTRFAHDAGLLAIAFTADGQQLLTCAEDRLLKRWETGTFTQQGVVATTPEWITDLATHPTGGVCLTAQLDGEWNQLELTGTSQGKALAEPFELLPTPPFAGLETPAEVAEIAEQEPNDVPDQAATVVVPSRVTGTLQLPDGVSREVGDADLVAFSAEQGVALVLETRAARMKSPADTKLEILTADGDKVRWLNLRSVRDSYVTFRPIDSRINGLRMHNWEEIQLNDYVYLGGEVIRVERLPRGPDSDFRFYQEGSHRRCYFGTSGLAHALEDPIYIVEPYPADAKFVENGLPVFPIYFENDDEESQQSGSDSRVLFIPPASGTYLARVTDVRGFGGPDFAYELTLRHAQPDFQATLAQRKPKVARGSGTNLTVKLSRVDGFEGPVTVDFTNLPAGLEIASPVLIEAGHFSADTVLTVAEDLSELAPEAIEQIQIVATGRLAGDLVSRNLSGFTGIELLEPPKLRIQMYASAEQATARSGQIPELTIRPGETITGLLRLERNGFDGEIKLDVNNLPHGIIVDNIGLSGVLVRAGETDREIFLTAAKWVRPQTRLVHAITLGQGNQASRPLLLKVVSAEAEMAGRDE